jgi:hypothetical protein
MRHLKRPVGRNGRTDARRAQNACAHTEPRKK